MSDLFDRDKIYAFAGLFLIMQYIFQGDFNVKVSPSGKRELFQTFSYSLQIFFCNMSQILRNKSGKHDANRYCFSMGELLIFLSLYCMPQSMTEIQELSLPSTFVLIFGNNFYFYFCRPSD